jgi:putative FmdB family regulatory protein
MASYDLRCQGCGGDFEVFVQGFLKEEHRVCPECGSRQIEQRITGFLTGSSGGESRPSSCGSSHGGFG